MSILNRPPEEVVLASPMEGYITLHNKPAAGARVVRKVTQNDNKTLVDETTTDNEGKFSFPIIRKVINLGKLTQYNVQQEVSVLYAGERYEIWYMGSRSRIEYGELGGIPTNFRCELTDTDQPSRMDSGLLLTKCKWDSIHQPASE